MLFLLAFAESSVFPIPPDALLIALVLGAPRKAFYFAAICTVGSVLGGVFGYFIGYQLWAVVGDFFFAHIFSEKFFMHVQDLYMKNAFLSIFVSGFTPIPYKVFTIAAGVFKLSLFTLITASLCGRALRFFLVGTTLYFFGPAVKKIIDKYFEWVTIGFTVLTLLGIYVIKFLLH